MKLHKTLISSFILTLVTSSLWAEVQFIPLYNRAAEDILPTVQATFPNVPITIYGNQLVINTSPHQLKQLQTFISQLDTPARRLLITVDSASTGQFSEQSYGASGHININHPKRSHGKLYANQNTGTHNQTALKQIMVNEGSPAALQIGKNVPVTVYIPDRYGYQRAVTQYQSTMQTLYVTANVTGENVHLIINNQQDGFPYPQDIDQPSINTRVSGLLGHWIEIGGINQSTQTNERTHYNYDYNARRSNSVIRVKVDLTN